MGLFLFRRNVGGNDPDRPSRRGVFGQFLQEQLRRPAHPVVFFVEGIGHADISLGVHACEDNEMPASGEMSRTHEKDNQLIVVQRHSQGFRGADGKAFHLQAESGRPFRDQFMPAAASGAEIAMLRGPVRHFRFATSIASTVGPQPYLDMGSLPPYK